MHVDERRKIEISNKVVSRNLFANNLILVWKHIELQILIDSLISFCRIEVTDMSQCVVRVLDTVNTRGITQECLEWTPIESSLAVNEVYTQLCHFFVSN